MIPIFRTTLVGGVLVMLALLAGFAAAPDRAHLARLEPPARGPLIVRADHPEWKRFLMQAAYTRASELERLRDLPDTPAIVAVPQTAPQQPGEHIAALPTAKEPTPPEDITGATNDPVADIGVDIGESSSTELPIRNQEIEAPALHPAAVKPVSEIAPRRAVRRVKARVRPPANSAAGSPASAAIQPRVEKDLFSLLFGNSSERQASAPR